MTMELLTKYTCDACFTHRIVPAGSKPQGWSVVAPHRCARCMVPVAVKDPPAPRSRTAWS